jgi:neuronal growth regulator 1
MYHVIMLLFRGNILKIHSVKKEDRGTYYCVADNDIGKPARKNVAVEVEFPPSVTVAHAQKVGQAFGYSVELTCHVEAYPHPTITWVNYIFESL